MKTLGQLAQPARCIQPTSSCDEVDDLFRQDPQLRTLVIEAVDGHVALVDRLDFEMLLTGPFGYGRALHRRRPVVDVADHHPLVLDAHIGVAEASTHILSREEPTRYRDVVLRTDGGALATVSVAVVLEELARLYGHQARHDPLTSLPNRAAVVDIIEARLAEGDHLLAVAYLDLDGFKLVNDTLGHHAGDDLLRQVATRLRNALRGEDVVGRMGGDEFVAVFRVATLADARANAERLATTVADPFLLAAGPVRIHASVGLTMPSRDTVGADRTADQLLRDADQAMYVAKRYPGSRVVSTDELAEGDEGATLLPQDLEAAVTSDALILHYQPVIRLDTGAVAGVEALVRIARPDGSLRPPSEFIGLAEATGLIHDLGREVLRRACVQLVAWDRELGEAAPPVVAVNLSPLQLADPGLADEVRRVLRDVGLQPRRLLLEVTETAVIADLDRAIGTLSALRELGIGVAIDDFGVGQSSLSVLTALPVSVLKIDRSFVARMLEGPRERRIVRLIASLAAELDLVVVAEGIETEEQAAELRTLACARGQGYLFARPAGADELSTFLRDPAYPRSLTRADR